MENWAKETDNEECWERVMDAWLEGQGQDEYPPTWEGLYVLLEDVQLGGHVTALKEAVESARLQGMYYRTCMEGVVCRGLVCVLILTFPEFPYMAL